MTEIKRAINTNLAKGSIHIFTGSMGIENQRERRMESVLFRPTCHGTDEGWREGVQSHDPNQLIGHHDRATKWHNAIPSVRSSAVVTA